MKPRDRVLTALSREQPDRCPMQISFTPEFAARLRADMGLTGRAGHNPHGGGNTYELERALGEDLLLTSVGWANCYYQSKEPYTDEWGIGWKWFDNPSGGAYTEMVRHPLANIKDPAEFEMPDFEREDRYLGARMLMEQYGDEYGIMAGVACTLFELAWYLRGMEQVLMDMAVEKDFAHAYLDKLMGWIATAGRKFARMGVDTIWIGDDVGMQNRMMIKPEVFREFLKPRYAKLFAEWKSINPNVKIAFHSDGYVYPILADLVEIGLDILNPIQPKSMDPAQVKKDFGDRLTLWGTIDIQEVMPFGSVADVVNEVKTRLRTAGKGGGLILSPAHNIQPEVPLENIFAFYNAAKEFGRYPIREDL